MTPQFVDLEFSTVDALYKGAGLWNPATRFGSPMDVSHWSAPDHIFEKNTVVGDAVSAKSHYNHKTYFDIWKENMEFESQKNARSRTPLESTPVGTKTSDKKIPFLDSTPIGVKTSDPKSPTTDS